MKIAHWQDEYCTGNEQIDQEHQELFEIVNTLHAAMIHGSDRSRLKAILDHLASHTINHFQTEEALMLIHAYPGYDHHKLSHNNLATKVVALIERFNSGEAPISVELTQFLSEWLVHHIKGEDQRMIVFFRERLMYGNGKDLMPNSTSLITFWSDATAAALTIADYAVESAQKLTGRQCYKSRRYGDC
jgi:hemerythrin